MPSLSTRRNACMSGALPCAAASSSSGISSTASRTRRVAPELPSGSSSNKWFVCAFFISYETRCLECARDTMIPSPGGELSVEELEEVILARLDSLWQKQGEQWFTPLA